MNKKATLSLSSIALSVFVVFAAFAFGTAGEVYAQKHSLTVINTGVGQGTVTSSPSGIKCGSICSGTFVDGKKVTLKAKPESDSYFAGWSGACTGQTNCTVVMNSDTNVEAEFEQKLAVLDLSEDILDFGDVESGEKVSQILKIGNKGTGDLIVSLSFDDGTDFSITGKSSATIKPNKSFNFKITLNVPKASAQGPQTESELKTGPEQTDSDLGTDRSGAGSQMKATLKLTTNDPKTSTVEVDCLASITDIFTRPYKFEIDTTIKNDIVGPDGEIHWTYTELKGTIPFSMVDHGPDVHSHYFFVDCQSTPGLTPVESDVYCGSPTTYTFDGYTLDKTPNAKCSRCTISKGGTHNWELRGYSDNQFTWLNTNLKIVATTDGTQIDCCGTVKPMPQLEATVQSVIAFTTANWNHEVPFALPQRFSVNMPGDFFSGNVYYSIKSK